MQTIYFHSLAKLYRLSGRLSPSHILTEVLHLLREQISFDGAAMEIDHHTATMRHASIGEQLCIDDKHDDRPVFDPVATMLMERLDKPMTYGSKCIMQKYDLLRIRSFARELGAKKLLLLADRATAWNERRWIALYRNSDHDFTVTEYACLRAYWYQILFMHDAKNKCDDKKIEEFPFARDALVAAYQNRNNRACKSFSNLTF
jgi:hypothetical protein